MRWLHIDDKTLKNGDWKTPHFVHIVGKIRYPLFVTMHFIPAALAAARPMALSSTTTQLKRENNTLLFLTIKVTTLH